jgi:hypothetical protein
MIKSLTHSAANQIITTTRNFWKLMNWGMIPTATAVASPPTLVVVEGIKNVMNSKFGQLTTPRNGKSDDCCHDPVVAREDFHSPRKEKLDEHGDEALWTGL